MSENKEEACDSYVCTYECGKHFYIKRINTRVHKPLDPSVIWKRLWKSTNMTMKTLEIFLWLTNNWKDVHHIWNRTLKKLRTLPLILKV